MTPGYTGDMQLHVARLCLDCNEVHDAEQCPVCTSEASAFLTRWIPAAERRQRPRPTTSPEADLFRDLLTPEKGGRKSRKLLNTGVLGVGALAVAGFLWQRRSRGARETPDAAPESKGSEDAPSDQSRD